MKNNIKIISGAILFLSTTLLSCNGNDAEVEKSMIAKIDAYSKATIELCNCVELKGADCETEKEIAYKASTDLSVLNDIETENSLNDETYSQLLNSVHLINTDNTTCSKTMYKLQDAK